MATLVLTAVGNLVGGPVGGAIGALIGNTIDNRLLGGSGREGPRLGDLSVQTSSYGSAIPLLYGRMRVAGTVIWSTDLIEDRHKQGASKGSPGTTTYSYSVSFAVLLSGRPIRSVGRIWADGKLLRGAAGDWKSQVGAFRLHPGGIGEAPDPLIASAEGLDATPAYDDCAYIVFEQLQLADFGNRIPSLTFEVEADTGPVAVDAIAADLSGGAVVPVPGNSASVSGYAAAAASARAALGDLADAFSLSLVDDGRALFLTGPAQPPIVLDTAELGAAAGAKAVSAPAFVVDRVAAASAPDEVQLGYYDPARDWGAGLQRARGAATPARTLSLALPAAMPAADAKACAEARLAALDAARTTATATLNWRRLGTRPGAAVELPSADWTGGGWQVAEVTLEAMTLTLKLRGAAAGAAGTGSGSAGRYLGDPDAVAGTTVLTLLDLPGLEPAPLAQPRLLVAAAGTGAGWRGADLSLSLDGGTTWSVLGRTAAPATIGTVTVPPAPGDVHGFDAVSSLEFVLGPGADAPGEATDDRMLDGANLALVGDELLQFGRVTLLGNGRVRLSRLLRGHRGSEWAMATHRPGERFVLLDSDSLRAIDLPAGAIGGTVTVSAMGLGDAAPAIQTVDLQARSVRPPAPVDLAAERGSDGAIALSWTRRSRAGWDWLDGSDAPLAEEAEAYRVTVTPAAGRTRAATVTTSAWIYTAAMQAEDAAAAPFTVSLAQSGTLAPSLPPATLVLE